ncbi:MAG: amylo-alpha-1,6-glucosidase [Bacteroidia bacterium]|nr:amylo-alpha-1,6-glucosidase [Bacteroidia bacterium]MDW8134055.1 amylo-alpha-1,6-glucosidase [Bacteroidia bacterium]
MRDVGRVTLMEKGWALGREVVRSVPWGGYAMTTLWGCPTRKYHSWFSLWRGYVRYELMPQMHEEVLLREGHFLLTTQYFRGELCWEGYRYIQRFEAAAIWRWHYRIGEVDIEKTLYIASESPVWLLRYRFSAEVLFRWTPLWAVRPWHTLRHTPVEVLRKGDKLLLPEDFSLSFRVEPQPRFIPWHYPYYEVFYPAEVQRGYEATETLWASECWEWRMHGGGEIFIAFSPAEAPRVPLTLPNAPTFSSSLRDVLTTTAENFFLKTKEGEYIIAGHPWFGVWGRDTFIALPGLTLARGEIYRFHSVMETMLKHLSPTMEFPNVLPDNYAAADTGLWWVWALIQASKIGVSTQEIWERYGEAMQAVLVSYLHRIAGEDGLLRVGGFPPSSWMDAVVEGKAAVERKGALVELNALWYAALRFLADITPHEGTKWRWALLARKVLENFKPTFWEKTRGYLADWREGSYASWQIRPNQIIAAAVPYRPISDKIAELILDVVERHLLTPRGLRSLSPADPNYHGRYEGDPVKRDLSYHNGTVWLWLLGVYADAKIAIWGPTARPSIEKLLRSIEETLYEYGWGGLAEIYDGDAPHTPRGAPFQAWSVGELLRIFALMERL